MDGYIITFNLLDYGYYLRAGLFLFISARPMQASH